MTKRETINWQSVRWPDGSTYEGLVKDNELCHVRGVFKYAGGDRFEGEYQENKMDGFGVYVWRDGTIYRGQWQNSMMHGCGVKISKQPNGNFLAEEGQFVNDEWVGDVMACTVDQARAAAAEADIAAQMARVFEVHDGKAPPPRLAPATPAASLTHSAPASSVSRRGRKADRQQQQQQQQRGQQAAGGAGEDGEAAGASQAGGSRQRHGPLSFLAGLFGRR